MTREPHNRHIVRGFLLLAACIALGILLRFALVPESYGRYGPYRGDALLEAMKKEPVFKGTDHCRLCHAELFADYDEAGHKTVPCEDCHFSPDRHAEQTADGAKKLSAMPVDPSQKACTVCHLYLPQRPADFPQQENIDDHLTDQGVEPTEQCIMCHNPHAPGM